MWKSEKDKLFKVSESINYINREGFIKMWDGKQLEE